MRYDAKWFKKLLAEVIWLISASNSQDAFHHNRGPFFKVSSSSHQRIFNPSLCWASNGATKQIFFPTKELRMGERVRRVNWFKMMVKPDDGFVGSCFVRHEFTFDTRRCFVPNQRWLSCGMNLNIYFIMSTKRKKSAKMNSGFISKLWLQFSC